MKLQVVKATTSLIVTVFIQDSSSTTGAGLGGLIETSSIVGGYVRSGSTGVALAVDENVTTEGTYQAPSAVGKVRIGTPANMRTGTYELHFHNDLFASGANSIFITLGGAANMADLVIEIQLTTLNMDTVMRGTDSAALAATALSTAVWTNAKAAFVDASIAAIPTTNPDVAGTAAALHVTTDAIIDAVGVIVAAILVDTGTTLPAEHAALPTAAEIWALAGIIDGKTPAEALQIIAAAIAGELSGAGTGTETVVGLDGVTDRAIATVDTLGNRSAVSYP